MKLKYIPLFLLGLISLLIGLGFLWPEAKLIPVKGAQQGDWAKNSFWFEPWGTSGVHKGIDIFAPKGRELIASVDGIIVRAGVWPKGGKHIVILGPKWRLHYYAHMDDINVEKYQFVQAGQKVGTVGNSGNAKGKPPHLHYTVQSIFPRPWAATDETQGARKAYYYDPHIYLTQ